MKNLFLTFVMAVCSFCVAEAQNSFISNVVAEEGAWCWFADPRALHYENDGGTINATYIGYIDVHGNVKATQYDWNANRKSDVLIRSKFQPDDHNNPTFIVLPDERVMIFYTRHTDERKIWYRISTKPGDITSLGEEKYLETEKNTTYPSPFIMSDDPNHIYLCWRGVGWHPTIARLTMPDSNDNCSFDFGPKQIVNSTVQTSGCRPYAKYCSNGKDKIFISYTGTHPDNVNPNWLFFNFIDINNGDGPILKDIMDNQISIIDNGPFNVSQTDDFANQHPYMVVDKTSNIRNWVWQVATDNNGNPVIAFTHIDNAKTAHAYWYAKWTGSEWKRIKITDAGHAFHLNWNNTERCYSGGFAINPDNTNELYASVPVLNGSYNRDGVFEIWKYTVADDGTVSATQKITNSSEKNNARPFIIPGSKNSPLRLVWMNGDYYHWIVSRSHPEGYPTAIWTDYIWNENYTAETAPADQMGIPGTITVGISMDQNNYSGTMLKIGQGADEIVYALDIDMRPIITFGGHTYKSQNQLYTSDNSATQNSSTTDGNYYPTKLKNWVLSMTYDGNVLTIYRNGIIDQVIETTDFKGGAIQPEGYNNTILFTDIQDVCHSPVTVQKIIEDKQDEINAESDIRILNSLDVPSEARTDIVLPTLVEGREVVWTSSDEAILGADGTMPLALTNDVAVKLTATVGAQTKDFYVNCLKRDLPKNLRYEQDALLDLTGNTTGGFATNSYGTAPEGLLKNLRSYTFLVTVNAKNLSGNPRIYDFGSASSNSIFLRINPLAAGVKYNGGTTATVNGTTTLQTNKEYKLAVSFSAATKTTKIYIDGVEDASGTNITNEAYMLYQTAKDNSNYIGRSQWWNGSYAYENQDFQGIIDGLTLYDVCLTQEEICDLQELEYQQPSDELPSELQNWDFEQTYNVQTNSGVNSDRAIYVPTAWKVERSNPSKFDITALKSGDPYFDRFFGDLEKPTSNGEQTYWLRQYWGTPTLTLSQDIRLPEGQYTLTADVWQSGEAGAASVVVSQEGGTSVTSNALVDKKEWQKVTLLFESDGVAKTTVTLKANHTTDQKEKIIGFDNVVITKKSDITLYDNRSNESTITIAKGNSSNVTIQDRTLYKDGDWNSICLPFALSEKQIATSPLAGAVVKQLSSATLSDDNTVLTLNFTYATAMEAGVPYLVKWETAGTDINNPVFNNVTINETLSEVTVADGKVHFKGAYSPVYCQADNKNMLFLGANSKFYYPSVTNMLNAFRGYFIIDDETANSVKEVKMGFEDATNVKNIESESIDNAWYTISGVKLNNTPMCPGIYLNNGKKIVIK